MWSRTAQEHEAIGDCAAAAGQRRLRYRVEQEVKGPVTTVVFEEGVHVCNNVQYKARPLIADWLVENL